MVNEIMLTVSDEDLAESLKDCKVGEEKTVTFKVATVEPGKLSGEVSSVDGYEDADDDGEGNYDAEEEMPREDSHGKMRKRMPRAIIMIGAGK